MSHSSACRGQFPIVALVAVLAVVTGVSLYASALGDVAPPAPDRDLARPTLEQARAALSPGVVLRPELLTSRVTDSIGPHGATVRVTVRAGEYEWAEGPEAPTRADAAAMDVPVRAGQDRILLGRLRVVVWE